MTDTDVVPLRKQYLQIKARFPDTILFFRLGDFYETFDGDAEIAAEVLDIVLTSREMGKNLRVPLAGIPYHAADAYIAKLIARQRILGLDEERPVQVEGTDDMGGDMIALPAITDEDINPTRNDGEVDQQALQNLNATPALTGAIPIAIFDAAMRNFHQDDRVGAEFYEMVLEFQDAPCLQKILGHVVDTLRTHKPTSPRTQICYIKFPTAGVPATSVEFPRALGNSLARLKESALTKDLAREVVSWLEPLADTEDLDPSLKKAIQATLRTAQRTSSTE